jgi:hypothetical protein
MFVSQPQYKFPFPPDLIQPGSQHWRMVELTLHAPWFLLSVEISDIEILDSRMIRTLCIAWDNDLAEILHSLESDRVKGIVCMMPPWQSQTGQWTSREIREVWTCRSSAGHSVLLCDTSGQKFDCGLIPDHVEPIEHELILRVTPASTRKRRRPQPGRRVRRANAPKAGTSAQWAQVLG